MMNIINAYTDGSSRKNGKPECVCGWAFVAFIGESRFIRYGQISTNASNNVGEIAGVFYGTKMFGGSKANIRIHSDSRYVVNSINEWQHKHALNDYLGIKNSEWLVPLYKKWNASNNLSICWVKGHSGVEGNELADKYAGLGADGVDRTHKSELFDIKFVTESTLCQMNIGS